MQEALNARKIEPKENVAVLRKLVIEVEKMAIELENNLALLDSLEQSKADKLDLQASICPILIIVHIYVLVCFSRILSYSWLKRREMQITNLS